MVPRKLIEHAFRLLPVLVVLPVLGLAIATMYVMGAPRAYESRATLWISESGAAGSGSAQLGAENTYASPAQRQATSIAQLLGTDSFALAVAQRSGLFTPGSDRELDWRTAEYVARENAALRAIRKATFAQADGTNLMSVVARSDDPAEAQALADSVTSLYLERVSSEATRKTDLAVAFYQQRLTSAKSTLDDLDREISAYVAAHPRASNSDVGPFDAAFERLKSSFTTQNALVTGLQKDLEVAQLDATTTAAAEKGRYALLDAAALPTVPLSRGLRTLAVPIAGAIGLSLMVAAGILYLVFATDHSVRSSEEVTPLGVPVLALIPEFDSREVRPWVVRRLLRPDEAYARRLAIDLNSAQRLERGA